MQQTIFFFLNVVIIFEVVTPKTANSMETWRNLRRVKRELDKIPLHKFGLGRYTVLVHIGSNQQPFRLVLATASSLVWVPLKSAAATWSEHNLYDPDASESSSLRNTPLVVGSGDISLNGKLFEDRIKLGHFTIENFVFGAAEEVTGYPVQDTFDGVFGMALRTTREGADHTILDCLFQLNFIQHREFGLFFREATEGRSYMVIGKNARQYMPEEAYPVQILNGPLWTIQVDWMFLGGVPFNLYGYKAIVDTGATAIYVPPDILETINSILEVSESVGGFNTVDCSKVGRLPALDFQGVNVKLSIYSSQYILQGNVDGVRRCYSPFLPHSESKVILLGISVLHAFDLLFSADPGYVVFGTKQFQSSAIPV
ncbi:hypothetical protein CRM22_001773 [Opisthorchis felineus]|uniref:Peptidase A1 domain-containing protein n=1 Tax=Opisthorchis felineus TaxID=147828 RepID=A0A4S2M998_OPIFE|nr:hypothetical protein CRM22_001773 [Opisthorchis felineus]